MTNFSLKTKFTDGGEVYLLSKETELAIKICIVNAITRSKKPKKDTKTTLAC